MTENRGIVKNIASLGIVQIANYVFPLITIPFISRIIGPDKLGILNYASAYVVYFNLLINYGFDLTAIRRVAVDSTNIKLRIQVFNEVFSTKLFLLFVSLFLFAGSLFIVPPLRAEKSVAVFTFIFCISNVFNQNWLFQAMQEFPKIAWLNFITKLFFTFIVLLVVKKKADYIWQPLVYSLIQVFVAIISFWWAFKRYNLQFLRITFSQIRKILQNEKVVFFSVIVISLYTTTNIIILGILEDEVQVGYYTAGQKLMEIVRSLIGVPLTLVFYSLIGKAFSESLDKGLKIVHKLIPIIILFTGLLGLIMLVLGPWLLRFLYGTKFEPSILVFQILVFIPLVVTLSNIFGIYIMLNLKMDKVFFKITSIGGALSILLNLILVTKWGYIGSAIDWVMTEVFITVAMYLSLLKHGINPIDTKQFSLSVIKGQLNSILSVFFLKK